MADDYVGTDADKRLLLAAKDFFVDELPPQPPPAPSKPPRVIGELAALRAFNRRMEIADPRERIASIHWLMSKWL